MLSSQNCDRFIPSRLDKSNFTASTNSLKFQDQISTNASTSQSQQYEQYCQAIKNSLCPSSRILNFSNAGTSYKQQFQNKKTFKIEAEKILDAPGVRDDFYLNILDWSKRTNQLAIALDNQVYLYTHTPNSITELCKSLDGSYVSCVKFYDMICVVGFSDGKVQVFDLEKTVMIREINEHVKRVSAGESIGMGMMITGSKDRNILAHDFKLRNSVVSVFQGHKGQVCALKKKSENSYNEDSHVFASGSNDNMVMIWDARKRVPPIKFAHHKGAVKAISWCPWKSGVIATAGGSGDKSIRIWNVDSHSQIVGTKKTSTQISSLHWNSKNSYLVSSHGCPQNKINFWKPQFGDGGLQLRGELSGHNGRVLQMVQSPNESMLCSLSADETIRFWRIEEENCWDSCENRSEGNSFRCSFKLK